MNQEASIRKQTEDGVTTFVVTTDVGQKLEQQNIYTSLASATAAITAYFS